MKQIILYAFKVCITTFAVSIPITMAIGMGYISLMMLGNPSNFNFGFNLQFTDAAIFSIITALFILLVLGKNRYDKKRLLSKAFIPIVLFIVYLLIAGRLQGIPIDNFLFSYCPMFMIMLICMKLFPLNTAIASSIDENNGQQKSAG